MPELPEVETTRRGIEPHLRGNRILAVEVRERRLRWPISPEIDGLAGALIHSVARRAKYLLLKAGDGTAIIHLGMSGSLRLCPPDTPWRRHDHIGLLVAADGAPLSLRFHDPRRFGCWLWAPGDPLQHPLLAGLGPEPLSDAFTAKALAARCAGRSAAIKTVIMDASVVVGVGNIYACEALFGAGIDPRRPAGQVSRLRLACLVEEIRTVLERSIRQGGTTLRDFLREDGQPGYFRQQLLVYDREGESCKTCGTPIRRVVLGQRSTFFCPRCQR